MKKLNYILTIALFFYGTSLFATATGHYPYTSIGFHDGTQSSNYTIDPLGRQATGSTDAQDYDIISTDETDLFVVFDFNTYGKSVYLVYTTDGSAPTKSNGNVVNCQFEKEIDPDRWWSVTIPSQSAKTVVKYVFYISDGALSSAWGRIAEDGYKNSWTEGDSYFGYAVSADPSTTYHSVYFLGDEQHDWRANEKVAVDGNSNFYISWDDITLYVGIFTTDLDFTKSGADRLNIGVDDDPGGSNGDASTNFAGYNFSTNNDGLHKLDYIVQISNDFTTHVKVFNGVDGSFDSGTDKNYVMILSQRYIEIGIPWTDIGGRPTSNWETILWTSNSSDSWVMSSFPTTNPTGDASTPLDVVKYHTYNSAGSGISPNSDGADHSLPVTLNSFTTKLTNGSVLLQWTTQSEVDVLGYEIRRATLQEGPYATIASYQDHPQLRSPGNSSAKREYRYEDEQVLAGQTYWYKLISHDLDGSHQTFGPISVSVQEAKGLQPVNGDMPTQFALQQNFPNPFNGGTDIGFAVASKKNAPVAVRLSVFNLAGQKVADLIHAELTSGRYSLHWDGRDNYGRELPSGVYFYRLSAPGFLQSRKMIFMR